MTADSATLVVLSGLKQGSKLKGGDALKNSGENSLQSMIEWSK